MPPPDAPRPRLAPRRPPRAPAFVEERLVAQAWRLYEGDLAGVLTWLREELGVQVSEASPTVAVVVGLQGQRVCLRRVHPLGCVRQLAMVLFGRAWRWVVPTACAAMAAHWRAVVIRRLEAVCHDAAR